MGQKTGYRSVVYGKILKLMETRLITRHDIQVKYRVTPHAQQYLATLVKEGLISFESVKNTKFYRIKSEDRVRKFLGGIKNE